MTVNKTKKPKETFTGFLNFIGVEQQYMKNTRYVFVDEETGREYRMMHKDFNAIIPKIERGLIFGNWIITSNKVIGDNHIHMPDAVTLRYQTPTQKERQEKLAIERKQALEALEALEALQAKNSTKK